MNELLNLINQDKFNLIFEKYRSEQIVKELSFEDNMRLALRFYSNKDYNDDLFNFAVDLLEVVRNNYPQEWKSDWRNDYFLGDVAQFSMRYLESYEAYKRASLKFNSDIPPNLLVSLAGCYITLGPSYVSIDDAEKMVRTALQKEMSVEAVVLIRGICKDKNKNEFSYWSKILHELEEKKAYMRIEWPKYLTKSQ
jgi:hypothetical protein